MCFVVGPVSDFITKGLIANISLSDSNFEIGRIRTTVHFDLFRILVHINESCACTFVHVQMCIYIQGVDPTRHFQCSCMFLFETLPCF